MALPTMYYYRQGATGAESDRIYVQQVEAALSATTAIVAAGDVGATEQVVVWWAYILASVSVAVDFQDSAATILTQPLWTSSQRPIELGSTCGTTPVILCTKDLGLSIKNYTGTKAALQIAYSIIDRAKAPYLE